jgi:ubiquitin carboxyl-terminal hydrolase 22/27/51
VNYSSRQFTTAGYSKKDSHEFYIALLNQVHVNCSGENEASVIGCQCVIHSVFSGVLKSTVVCHACGNVTVANESTVGMVVSEG